MQDRQEKKIKGCMLINIENKPEGGFSIYFRVLLLIVSNCHRFKYRYKIFLKSGGAT